MDESSSRIYSDGKYLMKPCKKARKYIAFYQYGENPKGVLFIRVKAQPVFGLKHLRLSYDRLECYSEKEVDNAGCFFYGILDTLENHKLGYWLYEESESVQLVEFRRNYDYKAPWMRIYMTHEKDITLNPFYLLKKKTDKPRYIKVGKKRLKTYEEALKEFVRFTAELHEKLGGELEPPKKNGI